MDSNNAIDRSDEWDALREKYLRSESDRPPTTGGGVHHFALISTEVERTIRFYQDVLGFPLTELFENRDFPGSTHFFFDVGNGNLLAYFDFPGLDLGEYAEVLGGLHHVAISVTPEVQQAARAALAEAGVEIEFVHETSIYFRGPDNERIELLADPLRHMYGADV